jgi:hypothetical protein
VLDCQGDNQILMPAYCTFGNRVIHGIYGTQFFGP